MCDKAGPQLPTSAMVLFRQVYPNWLEDGGEPSSQAFYPWRRIDDGCLSVDRETHTTAAQAHTLFTALPPNGFGQPSAGVWGLTVAEVVNVGASAWEDPLAASAELPANPAHGLVEFPLLDIKKLKSLGRALKVKAIQRGKLHP